MFLSSFNPSEKAKIKSISSRLNVNSSKLELNKKSLTNPIPNPLGFKKLISSLIFLIANGVWPALQYVSFFGFVTNCYNAYSYKHISINILI